MRHGEWEDATHPHERNRASYIAENFVPLQEAGVVDFSTATGDRAGHPRAAHRRAHAVSPDHLHRVRRQDAVFAADLMPTTAHVDAPWIMGYDLYPMETLEFKKLFLKEAIDREYLVFFEHDPGVAAAGAPHPATRQRPGEQERGGSRDELAGQRAVSPSAARSKAQGTVQAASGLGRCAGSAPTGRAPGRAGPCTKCIYGRQAAPSSSATNALLMTSRARIGHDFGAGCPIPYPLDAWIDQVSDR